MLVPKMCRIAVVIDDLESFTREAGDLLGLHFVSPELDETFTAFSVAFGEHGLMAIQLHEDVPFARDGRLIEVAIDVANAERTRDALAAGGYVPVVTNHLPAPDANEYLYGRDFYDIPVMVCTAGDNEIQMRLQGPFAELEDAPLPKVGCVTLAVADLAATAAAFEDYYGMAFTHADPAGLGGQALGGPHRLRLVSGPSLLAAQFQAPLAAIDLMVEDVEDSRSKMEAAGFPVLHRQPLASGGAAYYFGSAFYGVPLNLYPAAADHEFTAGRIQEHGHDAID